MSGLSWPLLGGSFPLEILHMPFRSREQCAQKYRRTWTGWAVNLRGDLARARMLTEEGRADAIWESVAVDGTMRERGLAAGVFVLDVRLRDALRALPKGPDGRFVRSAELADAVIWGSRRAAEAGRAADVALFREAELVRAERRIDELEMRVAAVEDRRRPARGWRGRRRRG